MGGVCLKESEEENFLRIKFDHSVSFKQHVKAHVRKRAKKYHALARYMKTEKLQQQMREFMLTHFSYGPLVWMFCYRTLNQRISYVHERALRIAQKDHEHDFGLLGTK